jgi:hypothetical protein
MVNQKRDTDEQEYDNEGVGVDTSSITLFLNAFP